VSVLLLGTVLISCATAFAWFSRVQVRSALREKESLERRSAAEVLVAAIITGIKSNVLVKFDSLLLPWFKPFIAPIDDAAWVIQIRPLDDKIPIRNIFLPDGSTLRTEMRDMWYDMWEKMNRRDMADLVLDFLDRDTKARSGSNERETHVNRTVLDMSELLMLEEMTPAVLYGPNSEKAALTPATATANVQPALNSGLDVTAGLTDYCTLWCGSKININVAPVRVMEILPGLNSSIAERIAEARETAPIKNMSDLRSIPGFPASTARLSGLVGFSSQYFEIRMEILDDNDTGGGFDVIFDKSTGLIVLWEEI
jgi:DNA uptake protein ComE-like DNA-binding protein